MSLRFDKRLFQTWIFIKDTPPIYLHFFSAASCKENTIFGAARKIFGTSYFVTYFAATLLPVPPPFLRSH